MKNLFANIKTWILPAIIGAALTLGMLWLANGNNKPQDTKHLEELVRMVEKSHQNERAGFFREIELLKGMALHLDEDRRDAQIKIQTLEQQATQIKKLGDEKVNSIKYMSAPDLRRYIDTFSIPR